MTKILRTYLKIWLFLLPIFFLPVVIDSFGFGKNWLMFLVMILGLIIWVVGLILKKDNRVIVGKGWGWLLGLTIWAAIFWYFGEAGVKIRTFMGTPGLGLLLSLTIWTFLWMQVREEEKGNEEKWLTVAGLITAITSLVVFLLPAAKMPISWPKQNPIINITSGWSLTGSLLGELWLLTILGVIWARKLIQKINKKEAYLVEVTLTAILVLVLFLDIFKMVRSGWGYLDTKSSWAVATESLKNRPLQGVGIGNFLQAFNLWRPVSFNDSNNWSSSFGWSANGILQLWTELGIVGLAMGILGGLYLIRGQKEKKGKMGILLVLVILASRVLLLS